MEKREDCIRNAYEDYKGKIEPLFRYIPWLEEKYGKKVSNSFSCDNLSKRTLTIPVYDGTLLRFVEDVESTGLLDRNYRYLYVRHAIHTPEDERRLIESTTDKDMDVLMKIMSRYILEGKTKGIVWPAGVEEGIYLGILRKIQEIFVKWGQPSGESRQQE